MLKKLYIDNFRCLQNFELSLEPVNLWLGPNGSGKSCALEVISKIQSFLTGDFKVLELFPHADRTRWDNRPIQRFELQLEGDGGLYEYKLSIEHDLENRLGRIASETLHFQGKPLYESDNEFAQLYREDGAAGPKYPAEWYRSGIGSVQPRLAGRGLTRFRERMQRFFVIRLNPAVMSSESGKEESHPSSSMSNYASWLRYLSQEHQGRVFNLTQELREILPGFDSFRITRTGEDHRTLKLAFGSDTAAGTQSTYKFDELSDGQRALVCLYSLIHCALAEGPGEEATICIDEPENYLALPEIQPWFTNLYDRLQDTGGQALLISHHPELINYLASSAGYWFDRDREAPVRVKRITRELDGGLPVSELVARGWIYEPD